MATSRKSNSSKAGAPAADIPRPSNWLHMILLYPTLAIALISAVPGWIEKVQAWKNDIAASQLQIALEQNAMWESNRNCAAAPARFFESRDGNVAVDATICNTGDLFIQYRTAGTGGSPEITYYWLPVHRALAIKEKFSLLSSVSFVGSAKAAAPVLLAQASGDVICQQRIDDRTIRRHLRVGNQCYDETVDTFTGSVKERIEVGCRTSCS